jgi:antitoxin FitA-like protein
MQQWQSASMAIQITIRHVPEKVRDDLASRAALQGKSMQEFLRGELERMAARPSVSTWKLWRVGLCMLQRSSVWR